MRKKTLECLGRSSRDLRVGVVVVTRNRAEELAHCLERLAALPERPPVVVVDNGSTDGTVYLVREHHPDVRLIEAGRGTGSFGRTLGVLCLGTPYVALCDEATLWEPGALALAADLLDVYGGLGAVTASVLDGTTAPPKRGPAELPLLEPRQVLDQPAVVRARAWLECGRLRRPRFPRLFGNEAHRLGRRLLDAGWEVCGCEALRTRHVSTRGARVRRWLCRLASAVHCDRLARSLQRRTGRRVARRAQDPESTSGLFPMLGRAPGRDEPR